MLLDCCVDAVVGGVLLEQADLKPETKQILAMIQGDSTTISSILQAPSDFIKRIENPPTDNDIETDNVNLGWVKTGSSFESWAPGRVRQITHDVSRKFSTVILGEDDQFGKYTFVEKMLGKALRNRLFFPMEDSAVILKDDQLAARVLSDLKLEQGKALPITYTTDFNMQTDESFSRIFFYGLGSVLLAKQEEVSIGENGPFVVDMPLHNLATRKLYRKYGARVHFNQEQQVTVIYDYAMEKLVQPGDAGWEAAKMLAKVTAFTLVTAREHLMWTHLIASNVATRESTLKLPPSHPIRRLLTIFKFRATEVNLEAFDALVPNTSFLHRSTGFKYSALKQIFDMSYTTCDIFEPFADRKYNSALQKLSDEGKFPYISRGTEYFEIVRGFVRDWIDHAGDEATNHYARAFYHGCKDATKGQKYELPPDMTHDSMVNLLSSIIFAVTAYHELVGHVVDYTILPSRAGFRLCKEDPTEIDLQSLLLTSIIAASTSVPMPKLMSKFDNFFGSGGAPAWEKSVWSSFLTKLQEQAAKVQREDAARPVGMQFKYFDPAEFECSVSV